MSENLDNGPTTTTLIPGNEMETVAIIEVNEVITDQKETDIWGNTVPSMSEVLIEKINAAQEDDNVKAILLQVNTPGGGAFASKVIYNELKDFRASGKVLVVQMLDTAASGGYFISAPADEIVASNLTMTGSIGVIMSGMDFTELYEKLGIKEIAVVNTEGNLKASKGLEDETSEAYKVLQSVLDDTYDDFVSVVAEGRNMPKSQVIELADGRVYSGKQAKELGLVDTIGEFDTAKEAVVRLAGLSNPRYITYETSTSPFSFYSLSLKRILFPELYVMESKKPGISIQYLMEF